MPIIVHAINKLRIIIVAMNFPNTLQFTHKTILIGAVLFICILGNITFINQVNLVYPWSDNLLFIISLSVVAILVTLIITTTLWLLLPLKLVLAVLLLISASCGFFVDSYGVVIDDVMIQNLFETNTDEAFDLFSSQMFIRVTLLALLPIGLLYFIELPALTMKSKLRQQLVTVSISCALIIALIALFSSQFTTFFREHKPLRFYLNPIYPIYSFGYFVNSQLSTPAQQAFKSYSFNQTTNGKIEKDKLVIVVVGETVRASNLSINGYPRNTMPLLNTRNDLVHYQDYSACGTSTAISVPCMFSFDGKAQFEVKTEKLQENSLDILSNAGVNVLWRDNNSSSKGVADRLTYENFKTAELNTICTPECRDIGMLVGLEDYLQSHTGDTVIVLHQMGNHGPAYFKRYPEDFNLFSPACNTNELSQCSQQEIINAYDNALAYTDYFLAQTIRFLEQQSQRYETAMIYVSDHGESLGENGIYLHGMPYFLAPEEQTKVPMLAWFGKETSIDISQVTAISQTRLNHDSLSYSLLDYFDISLTKRPSPYPLLFPKKEQKLAKISYINTPLSADKESSNGR